jgi:hypothetical protein
VLAELVDGGVPELPAPAAPTAGEVLARRERVGADVRRRRLELADALAGVGRGDARHRDQDDRRTDRDADAPRHHEPGRREARERGVRERAQDAQGEDEERGLRALRLGG